MIQPQSPIRSFNSFEQKLELFRSWGLVSPKATSLKQLYYKGFYSSRYVPCDVVGFIDGYTLVISVDGDLHCIHPECLAEMQPSKEELERILSASFFSEQDPRPEKGNSLIRFPSDFVVIDIETTGLYPKTDEIIELGAIRVRGYEIRDRFSTLIKPSAPISAFISSLTGITNEMLEDAPSIEEVISDIRDYIGGDILVGHNVNFDINFLYDAMERSLDLPLGNDYVDTMRIARKALPDLPHHRLSDVCGALNVTNLSAHRALGDCEATYGCFLALRDQVLSKMSEEDFAKSVVKRSRLSHYAQTDLTKITSTKEEHDETHPLYHKNCVFTGSLDKMTRAAAAQLVVDCGGFCQNTVTKTTNFLILGNNDYNPLIKDGKSSKQKKAEAYKLAGQDIEIIPEDVFYDFVAE